MLLQLGLLRACRTPSSLLTQSPASQLLSPWPSRRSCLQVEPAQVHSGRPTAYSSFLDRGFQDTHSAFSFKVCLLLNQVSTENTALPFQGAPGSFQGGRAGLLTWLSHPVGLSVMLFETRLPGKSGHLQVHCDCRCHVPDSSLPASPVSAPLLTSQTNIFLLFLLMQYYGCYLSPWCGNAGS